MRRFLAVLVAVAVAASPAAAAHGAVAKTDGAVSRQLFDGAGVASVRNRGNFFGQVKHEENNSLLDLNLRERIALWPAAIMALVMGVAPLLWLNAIDPAVHNVLAAMPQMVAKAVGQ